MKVGIDLGGTKIEIIVLDDANHEIWRKRCATPQGDYAATLAVIARLVREVSERFGRMAKVGIGIPGAISRQTGKIKNANSVCLIGQDLKADLEAELGLEVRLANDANCFALSEASDGAAAGYANVFGVIIGTGCGGGVVMDGKILNGVNAIGGEWGHNPLPWATERDQAHPCYCGLNGCLETFLSGPGMARHFAALFPHAAPDAPWQAKQIAQAAKEGHENAEAMLEMYAIWLAKGLASVMNLLDPDAIVLGGGMSNLDLIYERVPQLWTQWVFSDRVDTVLLRPKWGDSSGVRGAAWL